MAERRFDFSDTPLEGLIVVARRRIGDERGFLQRIYCRDELRSAGFVAPIAQINHTLTKRRGAIRGMHFQRAPAAEDKFVSVLAGDIFDVAVDLRRGSPTFLRWHGERLSVDNGRSLFIPKGFAHGFQTLTDDCELLYLHTAGYAAGAEDAVNALDPVIAIDWPIPVTEMSARDRAHSCIDDSFAGIEL